MKTQNMTTLSVTTSISRSPLRLAFLLIPLVLACFALSPTAQAQLPSPAPDGGYPNNNTAEGDNALASLTTGTDNTANGFNALNSNTTGHNNTATGFNALNSNIGNAGATEVRPIRIGTVGTQTKTFIAGINGVDKSSGNPVFIDANGQLGTASASPPGSVVMLPTAGGVAPPAPAGYVFKGF